jgi:hypothetical protein
MKMNDKVAGHITNFMNAVGEYIHMEYDPFFYEQYTSDNNLSGMFDFVGSYYMGGSNVPDTARYVVELILMRKRDEKHEKPI